MPTYDYLCGKCKHEFTDIKGIKAYSEDSNCQCPSCDTKCTVQNRDFSRLKVHLTGTQVESAEFNPGLGCVVKSKKHREEIAKKKGYVEVGNDFNSGEKMQTDFEKKKKEELETNWNKDPSSFTI